MNKLEEVLEHARKRMEDEEFEAMLEYMRITRDRAYQEYLEGCIEEYANNGCSLGDCFDILTQRPLSDEFHKWYKAFMERQGIPECLHDSFNTGQEK